MDDSTFVLKWTFEADELAEDNRLTIALKELFRDHHIEDARLIRDGHEDHSIRCAGSLLHNRQPSRPHIVSCFSALQV